MSIPTNAKPVIEFRGCDMLCIAEVTKDDASGITFGAVENLAPIGQYGKTASTSTATKFYDNIPAMVINTEGADTITLLVPVLPLERLAKITGKAYDASTGAFLDGDSQEKYFALGVRLKLTDGTYRYIWRYKGSFAIPDENANTENDTTDTQNMTLTYTGIKTAYSFSADGRSKGIVVDERDGKCSPTKLKNDWFGSVVTSDDVDDFAIIQSLTLPVTDTVVIGADKLLNALVVPSYAPVTVSWTTSSAAIASIAVDAENDRKCTVTGVAAGIARITATAGTLSATCIVEVTST